MCAPPDVVQLQLPAWFTLSYADGRCSLALCGRLHLNMKAYVRLSLLVFKVPQNSKGFPSDRSYKYILSGAGHKTEWGSTVGLSILLLSKCNTWGDMRFAMEGPCLFRLRDFTFPVETTLRFGSGLHNLCVTTM